MRRYSEDAIDAELLPVIQRETVGSLPEVIRLMLPRADADTPGFRIERRTPSRTPALEADVFVPGLQAVFTAVAACITVGLLAWAFGWSWRVPVVLCALALAGAWLWRLRVMDSLLWIIESATGLDTPVKQTGTPVHDFTLRNPGIARQSAHRAATDTANVSRRGELLRFVGRCYLAGCSESAHGLHGGGGPDRERYRENRDALIALGVADWKNPNRPSAGWKLIVPQSEAMLLVSKHTL